MAGLHKSTYANPVINFIDSASAAVHVDAEGIRRIPDAEKLQLFLELRRARHGQSGHHDRDRRVPGDELRRQHAGSPSTSVERIMRDVNFGWLLRYAHANGASMFFIVVYVHIFRALYYGSYKAPREILFILGVIIFLLMMATAFMGYVLPWGQMSYWGATVITNLFSAIPYVGDSIVTLLWGGFSVDNPTLNRFFALHYLLPFMIFGVVFLHVVALHITGSNNPLGIDVKTPQDTHAVPPLLHRQGQRRPLRVPVGVCAAGVLRAEPARRPRQLHPGQPAGDAGTHRAGMVLQAVLRHAACGRVEARRRDR